MPSSEPCSERLAIAVIVGPTAVGKTAVSLDLAERFGGEIINADSMQVYRGFDIGTDKPGPAERARVPHHLLDIVDGRIQFTAADFAVRAAEAAGAIVGRGRLPIIVGGTGLYIKALFEGLFPGPGRDDAVRGALEEEARRDGWDALRLRLESLDPAYAARIGRNDRIRIVRALEVQAVTGIPLSEHFRRTKGYLQGWTPILIGLRRDRAALRERIGARVERMFERGLVEEVRGLRAAGLEENDPPFKALGYRHVLRFLRGEAMLEQTRLETTIDTRHYAKRQETWFRKTPGLVWFDADDGGAIAAHLHSQKDNHG
jgi:tRNA dimethylallyltransferase